jgi:hypothetical protein
VAVAQDITTAVATAAWQADKYYRQSGASLSLLRQVRALMA